MLTKKATKTAGTKATSTAKPKKAVTRFRPMIFSRHPSHSPLRTRLPLMPFRSVIRLGSTTDKEDTVTNGGTRIELNTMQAVRNSSSKLLMKQCFSKAGVKTADWYTCIKGGNNNFLFYAADGTGLSINALPFPMVAKSHFGSRGEGNTLIQTQADLERWLEGKTVGSYIFEKFYNYAHEFRLHVSANGCFYTCRKALKKDVPEKEKWHFHDDTCVWFREDNKDFFKPNSWNDIVEDCKKALLVMGADILAFDVKVQSPANNKGKPREYQEYILIESNSAPSFGETTIEKYLEEIPRVLNLKKKV